MKRENKLFIICSCFLLLLGGSGCSSSDGPDIDLNEDPKEEPKEEVRFTVSLNGIEITKATIDGTAFEEGNDFKLYFNSEKPKATENEYVRVYTLQTSKEWTAPTPMYWDDQDKVLRDITAITPYTQYVDDDGSTHSYGYTFNDTDTDHFTVKQNQSAEGNYQLSDLLIARTNTDKRLIPLPFYHVMSRILVNVGAPTKVNPDGWFTVEEFTDLTATLTNMYPKAAIKYGANPTDTKSDITVTAEAELESKSIIMYPLPGYPKENVAKDSVFCSFIAIIPPRATVEQGKTLLSIKIAKEDDKGNTYLFKPGSLGSDFSNQGLQTTINLSLKKTDVITEIVETDIKIVPWNTKEVTDENPITLK